MRLVTRADFDGLVCGALLTKFEPIDSYLFVEPKFMQDGLVEIRAGDIIANLPYHPNCTLWFDHHVTNTTPDFAKPIVLGKGGFRLAPSAARVVYEYYKELGNQRAMGSGEERRGTRPTDNEITAFLDSERIKYLLHETDRIDAGKLEPQDVLDPQGYVLISMTTDGRNAGDEPYWLRIIELLRDASLEEVLSDPEVSRRCQQIRDEQEQLRRILLARTDDERQRDLCGRARHRRDPGWQSVFDLHSVPARQYSSQGRRRQAERKHHEHFGWLQYLQYDSERKRRRTVKSLRRRRAQSRRLLPRPQRSS